MPTIRIVNYPVYYPVKSDNPPDNPPDRPPERRWPWSASARLPPSTTLGATFKQGRTRSRCHLDYFGNGTARRRNTAVTVRKGMGGGSRTEVAVRRFAPYPASSTRSAPPLCEAWVVPPARPVGCMHVGRVVGKGGPGFGGCGGVQGSRVGEQSLTLIPPTRMHRPRLRGQCHVLTYM